jgi:hypothetical protein
MNILVFAICILIYLIFQFFITFAVMREVGSDGIDEIISELSLYLLIVAGPEIILGIILAYQPFKEKKK